MNKNLKKFILGTFVITSLFTDLVYGQDCYDTWDTASKKVKSYKEAKNYCADQGMRLPLLEEFRTLTSSINPCADDLTSRRFDEYVTSTPVVIIDGNSRTPHKYLFMKYFIGKKTGGSYYIVESSGSKLAVYYRGLKVVCVQD